MIRVGAALADRSAADLREQIARAAGSPFYAERWQGVELDAIRGVEDIGRLPLIEKVDLRRSQEEHPPLGGHLVADPAAVVQVQATSGSSGRPLYVALSAADREMWKQMGAGMLGGAGVGPGAVCLHAWGMSKGFVGGLPVAQMLEAMDACLVPMGAESGIERMEQVVKDLRPTALVGTPSYAMYLGERTQAWREEEGVTVANLCVGGEPGGGIPHVRRRLDELWGGETREVMGCSEIGSGMWAECAERDGMHYTAGDSLLVELVDENGEWLPVVPGARGEIVYTNVRRDVTPLLRYRSRDLIEIIDTTCSCGNPGPRLRCVGRTDDMVIVRGVNIYPTAVIDIVATFDEELTGRAQIVKDFEGVRTERPLRVRVESRRPGTLPDGETRQALTEAISERIQRSLACRTVVELLEYGSLSSGGAAKAALIVDEVAS